MRGARANWTTIIFVPGAQGAQERLNLKHQPTFGGHRDRLVAVGEGFSLHAGTAVHQNDRDASTTASMTLVSKPQTAAPWTSPFLSWLLRINTATVVEADVGSSANYTGTGFAIPELAVGVWHHLALTYQNPAMRLYFDGALVGNVNFTGPIGYGAQPVLIGADYGIAPAGDFMDGTIDQVAIWGRADCHRGRHRVQLGSWNAAAVTLRRLAHG